MSVFSRLSASVAALLLVIAAAASAQSAQPGTGRIRGQVVDDSDGVVPGATVEVLVASRVVATTISDAQGAFVLEGVPVGSVTLRLALDGFEAATVAVTVQDGVDAQVSGVLRVAPLAETVTVRAPAPPPPPPYTPPPPPEPPYEPQPISRLDLALVCGPAKPAREPEVSGALGAHRRDAGRVLYRLGDEVMLDAPASAGVAFAVGQNLVARRYYKAEGGGANAKGEYTAGVVQVARVGGAGVSAVVIHACGELMQGDWLTPFVPEPLLIADPIGMPTYRDAAS